MINAQNHGILSGQLDVFGQTLDLNVLRNSSSSELVNYTLVLPKQAFPISCQIKKSFMHSYFPSEYVQSLASILPYLSKSPASILTILPSIMLANTYLTFLPNYFASPFFVSGVSIPLILKVNLVGVLLKLRIAFTESPSVTLHILAKNVLQLSENQGASLVSARELYSCSERFCILDKVIPSGRNAFNEVSIIYRLLSLIPTPFLPFTCFLLSVAEPQYYYLYLSPQQCNPNLIIFSSKLCSNIIRMQLRNKRQKQFENIHFQVIVQILYFHTFAVISYQNQFNSCFYLSRPYFPQTEVCLFLSFWQLYDLMKKASYNRCVCYLFLEQCGQIYNSVRCKFKLNYSQMIELSEDPQSMQLLQSKTINLHTLKNSIDKRILRITCMLKKFNKKKKRSSLSHYSTHIHQENKYIQTQGNQQRIIQKGPSLKVLGDINQQQVNNRSVAPCQKQQRKFCSSNKRSNLKGISQKKEEKEQYLIKKVEDEPIQCEHQLIQSNGFTFRDVQAPNQSSTDRKNIQNSQDDKFFQSLDFALQIQNVQMCNSITDSEKMYKTVAASKQTDKNQTLMVSSFTDLSGSEISGRRVNKKIKFGGKQVMLHEPVKRIIVGEQCKERLQKSVEQLFNKKRKEVCDQKMRINVLKKIEDRYGEQYST